MKIFLSVAAWGDKNLRLLANYSFASLLAPNNLPALARDHSVTVHIVTSNRDYERFRVIPTISSLAEHCRVVWDRFEDLKIGIAPVDTDVRKYDFMTALQNVAMARARDHDALIFNYADFVWADGSLPGAVDLLKDGVDAVLGFCMPVEISTGITALDPFRMGQVMTIAPRKLAAICLDSLHRDATYRYWDAPAFTHFPSYLLFRAGSDGVVVRAYHQTALVLRVKPNDPDYRRGITHGTLDGHYTSEIAKHGRIVHADDSDKVMVFSLHDQRIDSRMRGGNRDTIMRQFVNIRVDAEQRRFAETPIRLKRGWSGEAPWRAIERDTGEMLRRFQPTSG
jgi:hypothetical protein